MKRIVRILALISAVLMLSVFLPSIALADWWGDGDDGWTGGGNTGDGWTGTRMGGGWTDGDWMGGDDWMGDGYWDEDGNFHPYIDATEYVPQDDDELPYWYPEDLSSWTFTPASPDAPRVVDDADILSDEEEAMLRAKIAEITADGSADVVIFTDNSTHGFDRSVYAADFYDFGGYGAGPDHTGFCLFICMDPNARGGWCCTTGRARNIYTEDIANRIDDELYPLLKQGRYYDGFIGWLNDIGDLIARGGLQLPDWYPESIHDWEFVPAAETAPRVTDDAGLFTPEEEASLEAMIKSVSEKTGADIVVFTDSSTHAFDTDAYASDFFKYNGYGKGANREGFCLLISKDPYFPGIGRFVSQSYAPLYSEAAEYAINSAVKQELRTGSSFAAAKTWIECVDNMLCKGVPFPPEWYPSKYDQFTREHDASAPRVDDRDGIFTAEQVRKLTEKAAKISKKRGVDIVIHTTGKTYGYETGHYAEAYYKYNGYGYGNDYDGALLTLIDGGDFSYESFFGKANSKLSERNRRLLEEGITPLIVEGNYYEAANRWLSYLNTTLLTGHTPRTPGVWGLRGLLAGLVSLIASSVSSAKAKRSMVTVRSAYEANDHLVRDSFRLDALRDEYTHSTTTTVYSPVARESSSSGGSSSGGSSSGGSSYSGSYSGSSGTSHTGSGRDF
ncbi:MAG: TPM domain-containing protein [Clostridiales bacterium]|nr:TPM domain-containing protein [Clostridiales bacterium]